MKKGFRSLPSASEYKVNGNEMIGVRSPFPFNSELSASHDPHIIMPEVLSQVFEEIAVPPA